tara:strand:+ start:2286 stop:3410 length:1125 start_codon:yes stop_codon:yes gene_type:complete
MKVCFVTRDCNFFITHRLDLAKKLSKRFKIFLIASNQQSFSKDIEIIQRCGIEVYHIPIRSSTYKIFGLINYILCLKKQLKELKPDFVFYVTLEISFIGALINNFINIKKSFFLITGLGPFFYRKKIKYQIIRYLQKCGFLLLRFKKNYLFIFQNDDDSNEFIEAGITKEKYSTVIRGNGIDLKKFPYSIRKISKKVTFLFASRLVYSKGINEFLFAASFLKKIYPSSRFIVVGKYDSSDPDSINLNDFSSLKNNQSIEYSGTIPHDQMPKCFENASVFVMPSYSEGLPKVALEAASTGLPLLMTNTRGCKDCIEPNVNGLLVNLRDPHDLADKMKIFIENTELINNYGANSAEIIKKKFSLELISKEYLKLLN